MPDGDQPSQTGFLPSRDAFGFTNAWPPGPALVLPAPLRPVGIGNAARGLCGGMVYAALDYWHAGSRPPVTRPEPGSPLYGFIVRRLIDSWRLPSGVAAYYGWMSLPDADIRLRRGGPAIRGVRRRSVSAQWPRIRTILDRGEPAPLGLVTVASVNPLLLGHNHQVLAWRYRVESGQVVLTVYDPNSGPDDEVFLRFSAGGAVAHNLRISRPVRGFFLTRYAPACPPDPP